MQLKTIPPPDWLTQRGGGIKPGIDGHSWHVLIDGHLHYVIRLIPVAGKFGCAVKQSNNGKHIGTQGSFATADEATRAGLEDARKALGW